ncbi:unnamed protein product [Rhizophagus irregularis]|nr:unnamed protein product [Rhizophagus irregularis]
MTYINENLDDIIFDEAGISEEEAENSQNVLRDNKRKAESKNSQPNKKSKKIAFNNKNAPIIINEDLNNESDDKPLKINLKNIELSLVPNALPPGNSWIWFYFDQFVPILPYKRIVKCLVEVQRENGMEECGHIMGTDSSTGNFIVHLACKHGITEETHKRKTQEMGKDKKGNQLTITYMLRTNPAVKNRHDQKFIGILVKDQRPISICNNIGFTEFIREFDLNLSIPK